MGTSTFILLPILHSSLIFSYFTFSQLQPLHSPLSLTCPSPPHPSTSPVTNTHTTNPNPTTGQKPWSRTKREAESCEAGPPNDQTRTVKIELLIKTKKRIIPILPQ